MATSKPMTFGCAFFFLLLATLLFDYLIRFKAMCDAWLYEIAMEYMNFQVGTLISPPKLKQTVCTCVRGRYLRTTRPVKCNLDASLTEFYVRGSAADDTDRNHSNNISLFGGRVSPGMVRRRCEVTPGSMTDKRSAQ